MSSQESRVYRLASRGHRAKKASAGIATPQPDGMLIIEPATGGQIGLSEDDFTTGPPELIVEVASRPLVIILQDYPNAMTLESNKSDISKRPESVTQYV